MTTLTPDELQRQQLAICEAVYRCYPRSLIKVLPMWIASNAPEQIWSCTRTDLATGDLFEWAEQQAAESADVV